LDQAPNIVLNLAADKVNDLYFMVTDQFLPLIENQQNIDFMRLSEIIEQDALLLGSQASQD
jgi:hypothetical protein